MLFPYNCLDDLMGDGISYFEGLHFDILLEFRDCFYLTYLEKDGYYVVDFVCGLWRCDLGDSEHVCVCVGYLGDLSDLLD